MRCEIYQMLVNLEGLLPALRKICHSKLQGGFNQASGALHEIVPSMNVGNEHSIPSDWQLCRGICLDCGPDL